MMILLTMLVLSSIFFIILLFGFLLFGLGGSLAIGFIFFLVYGCFASRNTPEQRRKNRVKEDKYVKEYGTIQYWEDKK